MKRQADTERKLYTLCILVQDIPGVLSQVARLFSRKGYNIESIVSGETDKPGITRITIGILADQTMLEQIAAQCSKLLPVTAVKILDEDTSIDGTEIAQKDDLGTLMQQHTAGDTLSITVARDGQMQTVSLTLGEKNASNTAAQRSANN